MISEVKHYSNYQQYLMVYLYLGVASFVANACHFSHQYQPSSHQNFFSVLLYLVHQDDYKTKGTTEN